MFGLFNKEKKKGKDAEPVEEQAVILRSTFDSGEDFGTGEEVETLQALEGELSDALEEQGFDCDGYEIGEGEFILYCYGSNADEMLAIIKPRIKKYPFAWYNITLRYGSVDDEKVEERHLRINAIYQENSKEKN